MLTDHHTETFLMMWVRAQKEVWDSDKCCRTHIVIHAMIAKPVQGNLVTPGAARPKFRTQFCVTSGRQAHRAQREQGRAVHEDGTQLYLFKRGYFQQPISYKGQRVPYGVTNEGRDTVLLGLLIYSSLPLNGPFLSFKGPVCGGSVLDCNVSSPVF